MSNELPPGVSPQELVGLHDRAADWFVRRQQPDWTGADERALDAWLGAHPLHRSIFEGMSRHWHGAPQLRELFPDEFGAAVPPAAPAVCAAPAAAPPRQRVLARWPGAPAAGPVAEANSAKMDDDVIALLDDYVGPTRQAKADAIAKARGEAAAYAATLGLRKASLVRISEKQDMVAGSMSFFLELVGMFANKPGAASDTVTVNASLSVEFALSK